MTFHINNNPNYINNKPLQNNHTPNDFIPLIVIVALICFFTAIKQCWYGFNVHTAMTDFMGFTFIVFGLFKLMNIRGFVEAYKEYDIIAKRSSIYAYAYPFIELALGCAYLLHYQLTFVNIVTIIVMCINSIGVALELAQGKTIQCACLGTVFKLPMTYVTLAEDVIMGLMALIMLFW